MSCQNNQRAPSVQRSCSGRSAVGGFASSPSIAQQSRSGSGAFLSQIEQALLNAQQPIDVQETEEITVNGQRGIFLNKQEVAQWRGSRPIDSYPIHQDSNPQIIRKQASGSDYVQNVNIRFLKPQSGQAGPIIIQQEPDTVAEAAPPVIIRQVGQRSQTPGPQVIREAPPQGVNLQQKVITIKGKQLPAPARKVIIEKLANLPGKPANVEIERWLAPEGVKRQVIFKPAPSQAGAQAPRNVIIEWSAGSANVKQQVNVKGVSEQNPEEYSRQYGSQLVASSQLPEIARNVQAPNGARLAADAADQGGLVELVGDLHALALIDLDAEGLGEYRRYVQGNGAAQNGATSSFQAPVQSSGCGKAPTPAPVSNNCSC